MHSIRFLTLLLTANAAIIPTLLPRVVRPRGCDEEIEMVEFNDGPTTSGDAGIGAEFETIQIQFTNNKCGLEDTFAAKRKTVKSRSGKNYVLSVDTSVEQGKGTVSAEYVLDGRSIRVGDGSAGAAGKAAHDDLTNWKPWSENPPNQIVIENYPQCPDPWTVRGLTQSTNKDQIAWAPQVTASMPLEALYSLMKENVQGVTNGRNVLNGETESTSRGQNLQLVTKDHFQALSLKMDTSKVNDAVLGFCTLVLSYAKAANKPVDPHDPNVVERSPKSWIPFMPRTEFITIYKAVKSVFPPSNELFDIFNTLACYKVDKNLQVTIDGDYCTGNPKNPVPGNKFGGLQYKYIGNFPKQGVPGTLNIKEWIQKIDAGSPSPDLMTTFDKNYDESIGGLGDKVEKMYKLDRTAPLFEFRDLDPLQTSGFEDFMGKVDSAIQALHKKFAARPTKKARLRRQGGASSCVSGGGDPTITPPPSIECSVVGPSPGTGVDEGYCDCVVGHSSSLTLSYISGAKAYSESCAYTTVPTSAAKATITTDTSTWTDNCQACTLVGGVGGGKETCTTVSGCKPTTPAASPTVVAWVANVGTIDIGNAEDGTDGGKKLATEMFGKLSKMCDNKGCKADHQEMDNVEAALGGGEEPLKPAMYVDGAVYQNLDMFDKMLSVGLSSWISALSNTGLNLCKDVEYEADADPTGSGCGSGPIPTRRIRRKVRRDDGAVLWEREGLAEEKRALEERCFDVCDPPMVCHYEARMCNAPDSITVVAGTKDDPYANHININLTLDKTEDGFDCEAIAGGLTAAMAILAPELLEADALEGVELESICGIIDDPSKAFDSLTTTSDQRVKVSRRQDARITAS